MKKNKFQLPKDLPEKIKSIKGIDKGLALLICMAIVEKKFKSSYHWIAIPNEVKYRKSVNTYTKTINLLIKNKIIVSDMVYIPNEKSRWYRLCDYGDVKYLRPTLKDVNVFLESKYRKEMKHISEMPKYLRVMYSTIKLLSFDIQKMKEELETYKPSIVDYKMAISANEKKRFEGTYEEFVLEKTRSIEYSIREIENGDYRFKIDKTSKRLHTNITNLKSTFLKHINIGKYIEIDISNSQPFLLNILLQKLKVRPSQPNGGKGLDRIGDNIVPICSHQYGSSPYRTWAATVANPSIQIIIKSSAFEKEFNIFKTITKNGKFYDYFAEKLNIPREEVKLLMFKILYSKNSSYRNDKRIFSNVFPMINQIIEIIKEEEHNSLAIILQRMESFFIVDNLCKRLVDSEGITVITKHDSIIVMESDKDRALAIFKGMFVEIYGEIPTLKIKKVNF